MSRAIGIFGGTFDPVHYGHLRAAQEAREKLELEDFRLLPAGSPPHRPDAVTASRHRLAMLQTAVADYSDFSVDDRECRRPGQSFMVDTLAEMRSESADSPLILLIGQDAANELDRWHQWTSLFDLAHLVIMRRPDTRMSWSGQLESEVRKRRVTEVNVLHGNTAGSLMMLPVTQLAISSTDIRNRFQRGRSPRFLLPDSVIRYIEQNQLYFAGHARKG